MPKPDSSDLAGWSDAELLATVRENFGIGADTGLPPDLRFRVGVTRLIRNRLRYLEQGSEVDPAVFFLFPTGPLDVESSWSPMLDNGLTPVGGRFWFVGPQAASGRAIELPDWDDAAIFAKATAELSVGEVPAVVFDTRMEPPSARFYPGGLSDPDRYEPLRLFGGNITVEEAVDVVERVHRQSLVTPTVQLYPGKLWAKPTKHWPVSNAEARIQLQVQSGLIGAFPSCVVRSEQSQATGRFDLEIEEPNPESEDGFVRHLLLELKVLRSFRSTGAAVSDKETRDAVKDGVEQAATYGDELGVQARALFCFDMRGEFSGPSCFQHMTAKARQLAVALHVWHLFATAKSYRQWLISEGKTP